MSTRSVITIGNFDGVHLGHRALITRARNVAGDDGKVVVLAFDPHPASVLRPDHNQVYRLTDFESRSQLLRDCGADVVIPIEPTVALLAKSAESFIDWVLDEYQPTAIVEGEDFRFGKGRSGDVDLLCSLGAARGFDVEIVHDLEAALSDQTLVRISSSMIRWLLSHGRVQDVAILLGRFHGVNGVVVAGDARGRTIGVPTANMQTSILIPKRGVFAGRALVDLDTDTPKAFPAAINIGKRPSVEGNHETRCEAHLIGFDGEVGDYGWQMRLEFHAFLRDEIKFSGLDEVHEQIKRDIIATQNHYERIKTCSVTPPQWCTEPKQNVTL